MIPETPDNMSEKMDYTLATKVQAAGCELVKAFNAKNIRDNKLSEYQIILSPTLNEARSFFDSIVHLCRGGYPYQAAIVVRTYFEIYITIKFLRLYPQHIERYFSFADFMKKKRILDVENHGGTLLPPSNADLTREDVFRNADDAVTKFEFKKRSWYPPDFPDLFQICKAIDKQMAGSAEEENYDYFYRYVSSYSHFDALSFDKHIINDIDGKKLIDIKPCSGAEHLHAAISFTLAIFQHVNLEFDLGCEENLDKLQEEHRADSLAYECQEQTT